MRSRTRTARQAGPPTEEELPGWLTSSANQGLSHLTNDGGIVARTSHPRTPCSVEARGGQPPRTPRAALIAIPATLPQTCVHPDSPPLGGTRVTLPKGARG